METSFEHNGDGPHTSKCEISIESKKQGTCLLNGKVEKNQFYNHYNKKYQNCSNDSKHM